MKEYLILEREYWKVVLHPDQYYLGRSVIISKTKHEHLSQFELDEIKEFFEIIKDLEKSLIKNFNWTCLNNDAYKKVNEDKEKIFHLHLRPRYSHPVVLKGYTFIDHNFGHHYERKTDEKVSEELMTFIVDCIKKEF